ncbi:MAG: ABC transporter permease [Acidobacteria bacterium]|nr:ABC transporter permease [Acidobacteriota bacterium]
MTMQAREFGVLAANVALLAILAFCAHGYFTRGNLFDLFLSAMPVMIVAIGMTLIILAGHIDISVGSVFALSSVVMGMCAASGVPTILSAFAACGVGAFCGAFNGVLVAKLRMPSIVVTLATMVALRDGLRWKTQGAWVEGLPARFQWFGMSSASYNILCFLIVVFLVALSAFGLRYLRLGRAVFATGSNESAARMAGIDTSKIVLGVFALTGLFTGLAAALNAARFKQIPSNSGIGLELKVIAAVAVGGAAITGGSASITGTVLGVVLLNGIGSALTYLGISAYWEKAIQGGIILIAVAIDAIKTPRRQGENAVAA